MTVDNTTAQEDDGLSFVSWELFPKTTDPILGANTPSQAQGYWPYADKQGDYGNVTEFVASSKFWMTPSTR
ncbi:hypothetical protein OUY22_14085 [Nonomuraea sp. MCN248]|uniref:Uncharacterized protein n=1 Tax=Nonomuraea corallina TaxID=2989783 RepID=A0ABT4SC38_9ACTN|nr:hypothetical protein [Nonomuraea corallina]MDA0634550.1 hypothetical protein [Nonomuraea corallina]